MTALGTITSTALVGGVVASANLTGQVAAIAATTIFAVVSAGWYRVSWMAHVTTAATSSSTLGGSTAFQVRFTNGGVVKTSNPGSITNYVSAANTTATTTSGTFNTYCDASTNLQYLMGYTSSGATPMAYSLDILVERI